MQDWSARSDRSDLIGLRVDIQQHSYPLCKQIVAIKTPSLSSLILRSLKTHKLVTVQEGEGDITFAREWEQVHKEKTVKKGGYGCV